MTEPFLARQITARNAIRLYVRDYLQAGQSAPTVLCLGGVTRNSRDFEELATILAPRYRVIAPDYRGRGQSAWDPRPENYRPEVYIDDIRTITAALNIGHIAVVGTSLGGLLAMGLGVAMPAALKGVLLNDVGPELPLETIRGIVSYVGKRPVLSTWDAAETFIRETWPQLSFSDPDDIRRLIRNTFRQREDGTVTFDWDPGISVNMEAANATAPDLWPLFRTLRRLPVLSVRGAISPFVPEPLLAAMAETVPDLQSVSVADTGHAPKLSEPVCEKPILTWLKACFG